MTGAGFGEEQSRLGGIAEDALFEMANLYPRTTGLPMTVWVSPRGGPHRDVRVKVCRVPGDRMVIEDAASVASWIRLNRDVLVAYCDGTADTAELVQRLQRV